MTDFNEMINNLPPELQTLMRMKAEGATDYEIGYAVSGNIYSNSTPEELATFQTRISEIVATEGLDEFTRGSQAWLDEHLASQ